MLQGIVQDELRKRGIGLRKAALEIGVSHTTLVRITHGMPPEIDTIIKICNWANISPSSVIDALGGGENGLIATVATVLERNPTLAKMFVDMAGDYVKGTLSETDVKDILAYINFRYHRETSEP